MTNEERIDFLKMLDNTSKLMDELYPQDRFASEPQTSIDRVYCKDTILAIVHEIFMTSLLSQIITVRAMTHPIEMLDSRMLEDGSLMSKPLKYMAYLKENISIDPDSISAFHKKYPHKNIVDTILRQVVLEYRLIIESSIVGMLYRTSSSRSLWSPSSQLVEEDDFKANSESFAEEILKCSDKIYNQTSCRGNWCIVGSTGYKLLKELDSSRFTPYEDDDNGALQLVGILDGKLKIFYHKHFSNEYLVGYRGDSHYDSGFTIAYLYPLFPYKMPRSVASKIISVNSCDLTQGEEVITFICKYDEKITIPEMYVSGKIITN